MHRRVNVYLDESGDLGSSPRSTRHMVVAALAVDDVRPVERALKSVRRLLGSDGYPMVEMKFRKSSCRLRRRFLEELSRANPRIAWCALDKRETPLWLREDKEGMLHLMSARALGRIAGMSLTKSFVVVMDRRWTKEKRRAEFDACITSAIAVHHSGCFVPALEVSHFDSASCAGLQAVDFVAGAVFRSLEWGDESYLRIIEDNILHGEIL